STGRVWLGRGKDSRADRGRRCTWRSVASGAAIPEGGSGVGCPGRNGPNRGGCAGAAHTGVIFECNRWVGDGAGSRRFIGARTRLGRTTKGEGTVGFPVPGPKLCLPTCYSPC